MSGDIFVSFRQYEGVRGLDSVIFDSHLKLQLLKFFMIICPILQLFTRQVELVLVLRLLSAKMMP